jgi:hypothetical protein
MQNTLISLYHFYVKLHSTYALTEKVSGFPFYQPSYRIGINSLNHFLQLFTELCEYVRAVLHCLQCERRAGN